jgi:hypothetical protein
MRAAITRLQAVQRLRWERLHLAIRCGLNTRQPALVRVYLGLGRWLVRQGQLDDAAANQRMLQMLLDTAADAALPWLWRSICLEHTTMPMARLCTLLQDCKPEALHLLQARLQLARQNPHPPMGRPQGPSLHHDEA